jgi:hypothetical protein
LITHDVCIELSIKEFGEIADMHLCLSIASVGNERARATNRTGFSNLHDVGRIRTGPVTNRGLRRRRPHELGRHSVVADFLSPYRAFNR